MGRRLSQGEPFHLHFKVFFAIPACRPECAKKWPRNDKDGAKIGQDGAKMGPRWSQGGPGKKFVAELIKIDQNLSELIQN